MENIFTRENVHWGSTFALEKMCTREYICTGEIVHWRKCALESTFALEKLCTGENVHFRRSVHVVGEQLFRLFCAIINITIGATVRINNEENV